MNITFDRTNEEILDYIDFQRKGYLFTSEVLIILLNSILSIKTRLAVVEMLGPRLIDPNTKPDDILCLFRYSQDKEKVAEILKLRASTLTSSIFRTSVNISRNSQRISRGTGYLTSSFKNALANNMTQNSNNQNSNIHTTTEKSKKPILLSRNTYNSLKSELLVIEQSDHADDIIEHAVSSLTPSKSDILPSPTTSSTNATSLTGLSDSKIQQQLNNNDGYNISKSNSSELKFAPSAKSLDRSIERSIDSKDIQISSNNNIDDITNTSILLMTPVCPGFVVKIRSLPSASGGGHAGFIRLGEEVRVYTQRVNGFYKLVDGRVSKLYISYIF